MRSNMRKLGLLGRRLVNRIKWQQRAARLTTAGLTTRGTVRKLWGKGSRRSARVRFITKACGNCDVAKLRAEIWASRQTLRIHHPELDALESSPTV